MKTRDLVGYGRDGCNFVWPKNVKIVVNFVINYKEDAELTPLNELIPCLQ